MKRSEFSGLISFGYFKNQCAMYHIGTADVCAQAHYAGTLSALAYASVFKGKLFDVSLI